MLISNCSDLRNVPRGTKPLAEGLLFFTYFSQNYHTVFTKVRYNIDNETRGNTSKHNDIINGTLDECREWCKNHGYSNADGRIAEITDDGDPLVTAFYEIED